MKYQISNQTESLAVDSDISYQLNFGCLTSEILWEQAKLLRRYEKIVTKNDRIRHLAHPKRSNGQKQRHFEKKSQSSSQSYCRDIEIVRLDQPLYTRTEHLAYPKARKLICLKRDKSFQNFSLMQQHIVNATLRKSLTSLYSHLSHVKMPKPPKPKKKISIESQKHKDYMTKLSEPKGGIPVKKTTKDKSSKETLTKRTLEVPTEQKLSPRLIKLAKCKPRITKEVSSVWKLTEAMKTFKPSVRLLNLARRSTKTTEKNSRDAKLWRKTEKSMGRLIELTQPPAYRCTLISDKKLKNEPYKVSPKALKAKLTQRVNDLAEPKTFYDFHIRDNPHAVSRAALHAKLTDRLKKLAQPKCFILKKED